MAFKFSTFNCRGLQDNFKRKKIFSYFHKRNDDIMFLQETHSSSTDEKWWSTQWGGHTWLSSFASNSRGVGILVKSSVSVSTNKIVKDPEGRYVILDALFNGLHLILVNVYAPNNDDPDFFLDLFAVLDNMDLSRLIVAGDCNFALGPLDYSGSLPHHSNVNSRNIFEAIMDEFNLVDIWRSEHPNIRKYTRHQKHPVVLSRLDYIFASNNLINNVNSSNIISGISSDHSIVTAKISSDIPARGTGYWKLNCHYLRHDAEFINFVKSKISEFKSIHSQSLANPNILWDSLKCYITGHCIEYTSRKKKERVKAKSDLMDNIEKVRKSISDFDKNSDANISLENLVDQLQSFEKDLDNIISQETAGLVVRSRIKWVEQGEKSSRYFCNLEKRSSEKKVIRSLTMDNGTLQTDPDEILKELHAFYNNLYTSSYTEDSKHAACSFLDQLDIPQLSEQFKETLNRPISKAELLTNLKSMHQNKSPGFDGLPVEFYIVFFQDIVDLFIASLNFSFEQGILSPSQRNGVITLLPKKDRDPTFVQNHRPISLLTTDYKLIAKTMANRLKLVLDSLIHEDQNGFMKGRNIGCNIRNIIDLIEYADSSDIPGSIVLLDIEKAFDRVEHGFLFEVLSRFNLGDNFIQWVKTFYNGRRSYVINNGFLSSPISMSRGIFQGCPISPFLFLFAIEILAIAVRNNDDIKGIQVGNMEKKISLLADDTACFLQGDLRSFQALFNTLDKFASFSGCKVNLSKSEAIHIGSLKGSNFCPFQDVGLKWRSNTFKTLGINFSLNVNSLYELNFIPKLNQIEQTTNCWKHRNLSLIGKVTVIKSLLLPQLLYLFSVLCINIPKTFFKKLDHLFYKFIWNGGNDRVKRNILCNDYDDGGLRMFDPLLFSQAQKLTWVKHLLDPNYSSFWKHLEISVLEKFHPDWTILFRSDAPNCVLNTISNCQLIESLKLWYLYRNKIKENLGWSDFHLQDPIWWNKNVRLKTKKFFHYPVWDEKGIQHISDLYFGNNLVKTFEDLVIEFDILISDRRKYNSLMNGIYLDWFHNSKNIQENVFHEISTCLVKEVKVPKYVYSILRDRAAVEVENKWVDSLDILDEVDWNYIHNANLTCTIETQMRSFYFKLFHKAICTNQFLHKIGRTNSPNCYFCNNFPETILHFLCECEKVSPLWDELCFLINNVSGESFNFSNFEKMFGVTDLSEHDVCINFLFLCLKFYLHRCKFQQTNPSFVAFLNFVKIKRNSEYKIAGSKGKLRQHFKKWTLDLEAH